MIFVSMLRMCTSVHLYVLYTLRSKSVTLKLLYSLDKLIRIYYERPKNEEKKLTNKITREKEIRTIYLHCGCLKKFYIEKKKDASRQCMLAVQCC